MADVLAAPQQAKTDAALRTLAAISTAHWVSHFHLLVLPMLFLGASVVFMILTVLLALITDRSPQASSEALDARLMQP